MKVPLAVLAVLVCAPQLALAQEKTLEQAGRNACLELAKSRRERRWTEGTILVIERNDEDFEAKCPGHSGRLRMVAMYLDGTSIIAASAEKAALINATLTSVVPQVCGGRWLGTRMLGKLAACGPAKTLEEYIADLRRSHAETRAKWEAKHDGKPYPWPQDYEDLRAELAKDLEGRDAVVLRYIHVPTKEEGAAKK